MISAVIISPDEELMRQLEAALSNAGHVFVIRKLAGYPAEYELLRLIRAVAPEVFFMDVQSLDQVVRLAREIEAHAAGTQIVAIDRHCDQQTLLELMRAGVREFLAVPFDSPELATALGRLRAALERKPPEIESSDLMFTFLPAKPGVGCTTLLVNTAVALADIPDTSVLLADFDLSCGLVSFLLKLEAARSITDAAEHAAHLDEEIWANLVCSRGQLDILPAGHLQTGFRIEPTQIRRLLEFARRNYRVICADLSGLMEKYSLELMRESKQIFLVCTPELPSLYLAKEKLSVLRSLELEDRVSLLLNRAQKRQTVRAREVENMLGLRVTMEFPNDYASVHRAISQGKPVDGECELGRCFGELARLLMASKRAPQPGSSERRFIEYFSLVPGNYTFGDKP